MTYQVLARKWRPQDFSTLVGQEAIVTALRHGLSEGKIAQAYLFAGIRGVGKTTAARVLAKALNCERGPTADPCHECRPCREIAAGSDLDVIEVDAATYSKVEQVRELTESLRYGPAADRYKVVVLDEIHRLSRQAFDALLKIVEEPPPHLTFIFATTEIESVPATLLSRCQEYFFRRVPVEPLAAHLRRLSDAEGIEVSDTALRLIARAGEGSVRDAVALLDQLGTFSAGSIADEDAVRLLGGLDTALFFRLLEAILEGRREEVSGIVREIEDEGWDPRSVYAQFLAYCRDAMHVSMGGSAERIDLPVDEVEQLSGLVADRRFEDLLRLLHLLLGGEETVRRSEAGALAMEVAWLRASELPKLTGLEELLGGRAAPVDGGDDHGGSGKAKSPSGARRSSVQSAPAGTRVSTAPKASDPTPPALPGRGGAKDRASGPLDVRESLIAEVALQRQPLAAHLSAAQRLELADGELRIIVPPGDELLADALRRSTNRSALEEAISRLWGPGLSWSTVNGSAKEEKTEGPPAPGGDGAADVLGHPTVQTVLELFGGAVESVERTGEE